MSIGRPSAMSRRSIVGNNGIGSMLAACLGPPKLQAPTEAQRREALEAQVILLKARIRQLETELSQARLAAAAVQTKKGLKRCASAQRLEA